MDTTATMFNNFRFSKISVDCMGSVSRPSPLEFSPTIALTPRESIYCPVAMFCHTIKKDATLFPSLKDDRYHKFWHKSFKSQAVAQNVLEVLDESYKPSTLDGIALFNEKQRSLYAVLEIQVSTDRGNAMIRDHEHDYDAQKSYTKIKVYHLQSTQTKI
jgi:hypothetical protein